METIEQLEYKIEILYMCAYVGFVLWGIAGWYVGRLLLRRRYIKPNELVNIASFRKSEGNNFHLNAEVSMLKEEKHDLFLDVQELDKRNEELIAQNKSLWYWNYAPHRDAEFITIRQQDKNGEDVATSQIMLPDSKHWAYEPVAYADDRAEDFYKWKDELPHQANAAHL